MVKQTPITELKVQRYTKPVTLMKLKESDKVISVAINKKEIFITTNRGYGLRYMTEEVPTTGLRGSGVKAISLKEDFVISGQSYDEADFISIVTDKGTAKRIKIDEFEITSRARKGVLVVRDVKTNPYHILNSFATNNKKEIGIITDEITYHKLTEFPICDRYQTGTQMTKDKIEKVFLKVNTKPSEPIQEEIEVSLDKVDEQIMTIDDFLDDLKND